MSDKLSAAQVRAIVARAKQGANSAELSREFGVSRRMICYIRQDHDIPSPRGRPRMLSDKDQKAIKRDTERGERYRKLADKYCFNAIAKRHGVSVSVVVQVAGDYYEMPSEAARYDRKFKFRGKTQTLSEWSKELGINRSTLEYRINKGWPLEEVFTTPLHKTNARLITFRGKTKSIKAWSEETGISRSTISQRLAKGLPPRKVLEKR